MSVAMMLTMRCRSSFSSGDRIRGQLISLTGDVELTAVGRDGAMAVVEGSAGNEYIVGVDYSDTASGELGVHCDCPRFNDGFPCKHLWAVIRKLDLHYDVVRGRKVRLSLSPIDVSLLNVGSELHRREINRGDRPSLPIAEKIIARRGAVSKEKPPAKLPAKSPASNVAKITKPAPSGAAWKQTLKQLTIKTNASPGASGDELPHQTFGDSVWQQQHWFVLSLARETNQRRMHLDVLRSTRKADGHWSKPVPCNVALANLRASVDLKELAAFAVLSPQMASATHYYRSASSEAGSFNVGEDLLAESIELLHATGRLAWKLGDGRFFEDARPFRSIDVTGQPWRLKLHLQPCPAKANRLVLSAMLHREDASLTVSRVMLASDAGYAIIQAERSTDEGDSVVDAELTLVDRSEAASIRGWQKAGSIIVPQRSLSTLLSELSRTQSDFDLVIDPSLGISEVNAAPLGVCRLKQWPRDRSVFDASLRIRYERDEMTFDEGRRWWWDPSEKQIRRRDEAAERAILESIPVEAFRVQVKSSGHYGEPTDPRSGATLCVQRDRFITVVETLRQANWEVLAEGSPIRIATDFNLTVSSGTDWFDLSAEVDFDGVTASLPQLLAALRSGNHSFVLDDGTLGMLPEAWLKKFAGLRASGEATEHGIRFGRTQALLLDAMLSEVEGVARDRSFIDLCVKLKNFAGIGPASPPETFVGTMRPYQQLGLGWLEFLREFRFGGCLADDMGLGKTIQVLAMLEDRRTRTLADGEARKPSIAVVPKSLIFNWIDEAKRFTPQLRVLNYTGIERTLRGNDADQCPLSPPDLILTTYGTLRVDAAELRQTEFDYVILDEAQAIKNPQSQAAKASRLLVGDHRLAMTGTPVENHLGDLWSLFDFLNPGMLGSAPRIAQLPDDDDRQRIAHVSQSLRPFILRRTKSQVLTELPAKIEQTLSCQMESKQRKLYAQLKEHYRLHLSNKVKELGLNRSKIHVLEALLRLRQAACDPRLVDPSCGITGSKITNLMEQLEEVIGEGHKALVFSQFTKLLALVKQAIDARGWKYEYLDGKTAHRAEHVKAFQEDDDCKLFLISLKAGGNGLNLTAADYVYILDPWWNPAVEAQAIDRAHRMGQTKSVMAYRMICEDTVEEKIIALQQSKRDLADAIISQDKSLISELTAEDLRQLLE